MKAMRYHRGGAAACSSAFPCDVEPPAGADVENGTGVVGVAATRATEAAGALDGAVEAEVRGPRASFAGGNSIGAPVGVLEARALACPRQPKQRVAPGAAVAAHQRAQSLAKS